MVVKKYRVTDEEKQYAADLAKKIRRSQETMWELLEESYLSGAHIASGFPTWPAFAASVLNTAHYRLSGISESLGARKAKRPAPGYTQKAFELRQFIEKNPGMTAFQISQAFGSDKTGQVRDLRDAGFVRYEYEGKTAHIYPVGQESA